MEDHQGHAERGDFDPISAILLFAGLGCVVIAGSLAAGVWMLP